MKVRRAKKGLFLQFEVGINIKNYFHAHVIINNYNELIADDAFFWSNNCSVSIITCMHKCFFYCIPIPSRDYRIILIYWTELDKAQIKYTLPRIYKSSTFKSIIIVLNTFLFTEP